jgi:hypothetical protein
MTGIFLHLKHVASLPDRCCEREALSLANNTHSFCSRPAVAEQFAIGLRWSGRG